MRLTIMISCLMMLVYPLASSAKHLVSDNQKSTEIIYFFSYHCSGCYALNQYITLYDEVNEKINLRRIPVFSEGSEWEKGAKLHVLLNTLPETRDMSSIKKSKIGFLITSMVSKDMNSPSDFYDAIEASGVDLSPKNFKLAWSELDVYLEGASYILEQASEEEKIKTPLVRVSKNGHINWISIDIEKNNPGVDFIQRLNREVNR
jgi:hypothetical protein